MKKINKCPKCKNPMKDTPSMKYGRFTDNEHPLSQKCWLCKCGEQIWMDDLE